MTTPHEPQPTDVRKTLGATSLVDGHQHVVYSDGTSSQTAKGATSSHSHGVVVQPDGTLKVLASAGHSHELASAATEKSAPPAPSPAPVPIKPPTEEQLAVLVKAFGVAEPEVLPYESLAAGLDAFCKREQIAKPWTDGLAKFVATPEGRALKAAYDADPRVPAPPVPPAVEATKRANAMAELETALDAFCDSLGIAKSQKWTAGLEKFTATPEGRALRDAAQEQ